MKLPPMPGLDIPDYYLQDRRAVWGTGGTQLKELEMTYEQIIAKAIEEAKRQTLAACPKCGSKLTFAMRKKCETNPDPWHDDESPFKTKERVLIQRAAELLRRVSEHPLGRAAAKWYKDRDQWLEEVREGGLRSASEDAGEK